MSAETRAELGLSLLRAAASGHEDEAIALIERGAPADQRTASYGRTALLWAAKHGCDTLLARLLPISDTNARDNEGRDALITACCHAQVECVKILLPHCDPHARSGPAFHERTALMQACFAGSRECVEMLLPVSDPLARDNLGLRCSEIAQARGHAFLAQWFEAFEQRAEIEANLPPPSSVPRGARPKL